MNRITAAFATKTFEKSHTKYQFSNKEIPKIVALDIGYSGVKGYTENSMFVFPAFVLDVTDKLDIKSAIHVGKNTIRYIDKTTGKCYYVGQSTYTQSEARTTNVTDRMLYSKDRYNADYNILFNVGIAMAFKNGCVPDDFILQTGLPAKYIVEDKEIVKEVLSRSNHSFSVSFGDGDFVDYDFTMTEDRIYVTDQPTGTLINYIFGPYRKIVSEKTLVLDIGFGTLDTVEYNCGVNKALDTFDDLGMHAVMDEASRQIQKDHKVCLNAMDMQKALMEGSFIVKNRFERKSSLIDMEPYIVDASRKIAEKMVERLDDCYSLENYKSIIVTGGTGEAWFETIKAALRGYQTTTIHLASEVDPEISCIFANVRGYFRLRAKSEEIKRQAA